MQPNKLLLPYFLTASSLVGAVIGFTTSFIDLSPRNIFIKTSVGFLTGYIVGATLPVWIPICVYRGIKEHEN